MVKNSDGNSPAYDAWVKSQKDYFDALTDVTENFQNAMKQLDFSVGAVQDETDLAGIYRQWHETFGKYFEGLLNLAPPAVGHDAMSKLFSSADAYLRLYEFWAPLAQAVGERAASGKAYEDLLDTERYAELLRGIFDFGPAGSTEEFVGQASKLVETLVSKGELFLKPWSEAMAKNVEALAGMASGDLESGAGIFHNLYSAFESTGGKAFKMPAVGKDREQVELLLKTMDKYSVFLAKNSIYQQSVLATGQSAMEEVVSAYAEKIKDGTGAAGFEEFFQMWTSVQEKEYLELFRTEEFARLQGDVLEAALEARGHFNKLMELLLSDYPVALRSEMDKLYQTVYNLKKSVRELKKHSAGTAELREEIADLKRKVGALEKKRSSRTAAAKPKTRAAKKTAGQRRVTKRAGTKGEKK